MTTKDVKTAEELLKLIEIMSILRSPAGCPWDKVQTAESLKPYLLEETYELLEAIDSNNIADIRDELGDLLLQVVFLAQIYKEDQQFDIADVAQTISAKLLRRHPHVFADASKKDHALQWENIKRQERRAQGKKNSLAQRIPQNFPALKQATKIAKKTTPQTPDNLMEKLIVGLQDLRQLMKSTKLISAEQNGHLSTLLYTFVELTSCLQVDAEDILRQKTIQVIAEIEDQITT
ncbi:MAG: MazG family protein [Deltaproteobacteria bacterium]|nr:MazG family protein [Deltaproteobacteria bacterium]MCW9049886.1 MazG family protein [Deltaproteobacteria bacterium]